MVVLQVNARYFIPRLASLQSIKRGVEKSQVTTWIRSKINFALLRSMILCLIGSCIYSIISSATKNKEHIDIELESIYILMMK